ncbi:MAG: type II toxin-antitoxin system HicA family toxin [Dehalococcoidia bacterium]|nr:type II toxin-antitoxin system HicA family toxin [Dehalococcoidia bacterium]
MGFSGPISGTKHQFMVYQRRRMAVPSNAEYSVSQLQMLLREVGALIGRRISAAEWERLGDE